ncbi:MAG: extracellular solute-binding protein [Desulfobacteraceae bacterium]|nr:extracellular solute-binding protein [Desulfobacteraceae bacterium]
MKTRRVRMLKYLWLLVIITPVSLACAQGNVLRLLVWEGYAPNGYIQTFEREMEAKYGIKLKMEISYALGSGDFFNLVRDKKIDVITLSHSSIKDNLYGYISRGLILPPDLKNIPNHANVIPDLKEADYHTSNGKIYGIPLASGQYGLAYNTKVFKQAPQSWNIFWNPEYINKYAIGADEYFYNINITAMVMGYSRNTISSFDALNNKKFQNKLRQLAVNAGSFWVGVDRPEDLHDMSFAMVWGCSLASLRRVGEEWKMADPVEGTIWWIDEYAITWALAEKPLMKKIAEEWINKSLSPDFQINHIIRETGNYPVVTNLTNKLTAEEKERVQIDTASELFRNPRILEDSYSQRDSNGLKLMWDNAMEGKTSEIIYPDTH